MVRYSCTATSTLNLTWVTIAVAIKDTLVITETPLTDSSELHNGQQEILQGPGDDRSQPPKKRKRYRLLFNQEEGPNKGGEPDPVTSIAGPSNYSPHDSYTEAHVIAPSRTDTLQQLPQAQKVDPQSSGTSLSAVGRNPHAGKSVASPTESQSRLEASQPASHSTPPYTVREGSSSERRPSQEKRSHLTWVVQFDQRISPEVRPRLVEAMSSDPRFADRKLVFRINEQESVVKPSSLLTTAQGPQTKTLMEKGEGTEGNGALPTQHNQKAIEQQPNVPSTSTPPAQVAQGCLPSMPRLDSVDMPYTKAPLEEPGFSGSLNPELTQAIASRVEETRQSNPHLSRLLSSVLEDCETTLNFELHQCLVVLFNKLNEASQAVLRNIVLREPLNSCSWAARLLFRGGEGWPEASVSLPRREQLAAGVQLVTADIRCPCMPAWTRFVESQYCKRREILRWLTAACHAAPPPTRMS
eukprot:Protomagalhaensia_sp_Gyna_25__534@NODE_124_length_5068_cov_1547_737721_g98_i0_p1_GENE_NODE_124_length_5068_cov_1547_737721_g98_i0NODE_124_length_5068_cov_1547_737721_g98_i0_p1_ORF_typecomplete_len469_score47_19Enolase_like_N/PF18374_1/42Enolase_like_N/PF18374_1/14_NODE_124_length_5068_cov_1547_737721_g98_i09182324